MLDGGRCVSLVSTLESSWRSCKETFYPRRTLACLNSWDRNSRYGQIRQTIKNSRPLWQTSSFENSHICCFETPVRLHVSKGCFSGQLTEFMQWNGWLEKSNQQMVPKSPFSVEVRKLGQWRAQNKVAEQRARTGPAVRLPGLLHVPSRPAWVGAPPSDQLWGWDELLYAEPTVCSHILVFLIVISNPLHFCSALWLTECLLTHSLIRGSHLLKEGVSADSDVGPCVQGAWAEAGSAAVQSVENEGVCSTMCLRRHV